MGSESRHTDSAAVEDLRASVALLSLEVRTLADRVQEVAGAVEALSPKIAESSPVPAGGPSAGEIGVSVKPLPELAMAAVAETALRGLPSVRKLISVERSNDQATFVLEIGDGGDLVAEMRRAMPVPFTVDKTPDGSLTVVLEWAWGRSIADPG